MAVIPNTEVRLLSNVPLNTSYEHTRTFPDAAAQSSYFISKTSHVFSDFTYQREDQSIKVPKGYDSLYLCNYVMYRNTEFSTKWFYGFITKREYINPNTTKIYFEPDVYQTWQFELDFKPSFIERQHCKRWNSDGTPVINTVDEGLGYGTDLEIVDVTQYVPFTDVFFLVIVCTQRMDVNATAGKEIEPTVNGGIQPLTYYIQPFKMDGSVPGVSVDGMSQTLSPVQEVLRALYTNTEAVNNIAALYITEYIGNTSLAFSMTEFEPVNVQDKEGTDFVTLRVKHMPTYRSMSHSLGDKYDGFTEVSESKLLMHPYTVTVLTDMKGNHQEIKNEYIQGSQLLLTTKGSIGPSNKVSYQVANYLMSEYEVTNGSEVGLSNGIINNSPNDVPIITDLLSAYFQGNRNSIANQQQSILFNQVGNLIGNALSLNGLGGVQSAGNSYLQMQGIMAKQQDINHTPAQLTKMGGNTAFDYGNDIKGLYIVKKEITGEYRKKLSDFFKMYGYKVNELQTPNLTSRQNFNFIKTVGANITGNVPQEDLAVIKSMFDKGVTLWHGDYVGDYTKANGEV